MNDCVGELGDGLLGLDLGPGVGGQGIERVVLVEVELLALAVDRAAPGEEEPRHAGLLGSLRQTDRGVAVDVEGELGVELAHRVVGDRRQVHDAVATVQVRGFDRADVLDQLAVGLDQGLPVAALEELEVAADDGMAFLLQDVNQVGPDETAMACDENFHNISTYMMVLGLITMKGIHFARPVRHIAISGRQAGSADSAIDSVADGSSLTQVALISHGSRPGVSTSIERASSQKRTSRDAGLFRCIHDSVRTIGAGAIAIPYRA